jgi:CubicO group peptidase (beta-lactamase class C family)
MPRFIRRADDDPFALLNHPDLLACCLLGATSATATAWDMAVFGQMFLNRGRYGAARILSPATVAVMTRDQIPGVSAVYGSGERFPQAGWSYGWNIKLDKRELNGPSLVSARTFRHGGAGVVELVVDPEYELVMAYFSVMTSGVLGEAPQWCLDHLTSAVLGAIAD